LPPARYQRFSRDWEWFFARIRRDEKKGWGAEGMSISTPRQKEKVFVEYLDMTLVQTVLGSDWTNSAKSGEAM
jgi:hypothetical protein